MKGARESLTLRLLTVAELPDLIGAPHPRPVLLCPECGSTYSAHRGDYFAARPSAPMVCDCREEDTPLQLVTLQTTAIPFQVERRS